MWVLYFAIGSSIILASKNNYKNIQYLCVSYKSWLNVQCAHLGLLLIDIKGSNMINMVVSSVSAILSYFVSHTLEDNIV
jgi:hypothetical protein